MIPDLHQPGQDVTPVLDFVWNRLNLAPGTVVRVLSHNSDLYSGLLERGAKIADADEPAAAALCWWSPLGCKTMAEDEALLASLATGLVPGAPVAIDLLNAPRMLRDHKPNVTAFHFTAQGQLRLDRSTALDIARGRVVQRFTWTIDDADEKVQEEEARLVMPHELTHLLETTGFDPPTLYGDISGSPYAWGSDRCIALTRRFG